MEIKSLFMTDDRTADALERIRDALERISPPSPGGDADFSAADAFLWHANPDHLQPVPAVSRVELALLKGVDHVRDILLENTERFASGASANNALLWGARGMGKSSLVKAVQASVNLDRAADTALILIEIHREDINSLPRLLTRLRAAPDRRFLLFCDDLSFDAGETDYKSLKAVLDGGIEGRPENVLFYATSNRRHLMPRHMIENERSSAINPGESVEEKVSLSDRFGLWLGFHSCSQDAYLAMIDGYCDHFDLTGARADIHAEALTWSRTRGARSGRVAWQYILDLAGRQNKRIG
jgi:predicted AAA+ superfamily ATPase